MCMKRLIIITIVSIVYCRAGYMKRHLIYEFLGVLTLPFIGVVRVMKYVLKLAGTSR